MGLWDGDGGAAREQVDFEQVSRGKRRSDEESGCFGYPVRREGGISMVGGAAREQLSFEQGSRGKSGMKSCAEFWVD